MPEILHHASPSTLAVLLMIVLTAGCRTAPEVGMRMILPPGAAVMDVPKDKVLLMAAPVSQPLPVLPAGLPGTREVSLCIELIVDEIGAVRSAVPIYELPECPLAEARIDPRIVAATTDAVMEWQFLAAAVCTFADGALKTEDCSGNAVEVSAIPIRLSYMFSFERTGKVTAQQARPL